MIRSFILMLPLAACSALLHPFDTGSARAQGVGRIELHTVSTVTVSNEQFLSGDRYGKPVMLAGELRLPRSTAPKVPVIVLMHGSGGINPAHDRWAHDLNAAGIGVFILDSFTGRGIVSTAADQSQLDSISMMHDAYAALARLAAHPRIDPSRIGVMGTSKGAVAAIYSSNQRFSKMYGPPNVEFATHIGLYTPCNVSYAQDDRVTGKPIRMYHGIADDYVSIEPCRTYTARLKQAGADVVLTEYPDAHHAYDVFTLPASQRNANAQTTRNCLLREGEKGQILNAKTGQPYSLANDACVEQGPHVGYNEAAHKATVQAVTAFVTQAFKLTN
jgi:dienelactone hydrolase